ncbi:Uncharacterised protein [Pseudomonas putida]|nr:Uncharacterised protein [Pseudomonas putida]CAB5649124.1 Uncharacterised protein [Pseudomonas putida]CAB5709283.1 Uncharacterised protein [Pseudomonas putida]CAB5721193.1 Uncharacterised protein [Pseudomonas putida]CAC9679838.1 Uncharacterised protein [Pseudomonas putida]
MLEVGAVEVGAGLPAMGRNAAPRQAVGNQKRAVLTVM